MVSLVIPVYNEKASLEELLRRVVAVDMPKELVVVDDCSTDGSREVLAGHLRELADAKLERVLTTDPAMGVLRHADAGLVCVAEVVLPHRVALRGGPGHDDATAAGGGCQRRQRARRSPTSNLFRG